MDIVLRDNGSGTFDISLSGGGSSPIKSVSGVLFADIKSVSGVLTANIKSVSGVLASLIFYVYNKILGFGSVLEY